MSVQAEALAEALARKMVEDLSFEPKNARNLVLLFLLPYAEAIIAAREALAANHASVLDECPSCGDAFRKLDALIPAPAAEETR